MGCQPQVLQALPPWFRGNIVRTQECISFKKSGEGRTDSPMIMIIYNHLGFAVGGEEKQELTTDLIQNESLNNFSGTFGHFVGYLKIT